MVRDLRHLGSERWEVEKGLAQPGSFWMWRPLGWTRVRRSRKKGGDQDRKQDADRQVRGVDRPKKERSLHCWVGSLLFPCLRWTD